MMHTEENSQNNKTKSLFEMIEDAFFKDFQGFEKSIKDIGREFKEALENEVTKQYIRLNVLENTKKYIVQVAAPGLHKDDFSMQLQENKLVIWADVEIAPEEGTTFQYREYNFGKFTRSYKLPEDADPDKIEAAYADGILSITILKKEVGQKRREIKVD